VITTASLLVAALSLDHSAFGQFMLSTPLVGGWLMGMALGDPLGGLTAGALLQFLCCMELPVGASIPPDGSFAGLIGVAIYLAVPPPPGWSDASMFGLAALLFFPLAHLSRALEIVLRRRNRRWTEVAAAAAGRGEYRRAQLASLGGMPLAFVKTFALSWAALGLLSLPALSSLSRVETFAGPLALLGRFVPFVGLGVLAVTQRRMRSPAAIGLGFLLGAFFTWSLR
jgi:mannose/fructose/N-acetylgalactosamine-specific phosphotransferase system component IIC